MGRSVPLLAIHAIVLTLALAGPGCGGRAKKIVVDDDIPDPGSWALDVPDDRGVPDATRDVAADVPGDPGETPPDATADEAVAVDLPVDVPPHDVFAADDGGDDGPPPTDVPPTDVAPTDVPTGGCPPVGALQWQSEPVPLITLADATAYCADAGMRVPTLCELRSFLAGCPVTEATGSCGVTDTCTDFCPGDCTGCPSTLGPENGCYWAAGTQGACGFYWSSTLHGSWADYAWAIDFQSAFPFSTKTNGKMNVRCVR
jgi:hypothetical protein